MLPLPRSTLESVLAVHTVIAPPKMMLEYVSALRRLSPSPPSRE
jgi:hypothetical protein